MAEIALEAKGLTKRFGTFVAVKALSLEVRQGEVFGFLGPNGAGKTTSISMLCGLLQPDEGEVFVRGEAIAKGGAETRARVGVCPQQVVVWKELGCLEQLVFLGQMYGLSRDEARKRGSSLLEALRLSEKASSRARTLSGGMQRRLNIALALIQDPEIVVLDEPEAGLDPQSRVLVREYIQGLAQQKTVIVTTHNMDEAERVADRVAIIDHGELLKLDSPQNLKEELGQGDVLEISFPVEAEDPLERAPQVVGELVEGHSTLGKTLLLRAHRLVSVLPQIMEKLQAEGLEPSEVRLRANTLEDVFIALTGRGLRE